MSTVKVNMWLNIYLILGVLLCITVKNTFAKSSNNKKLNVLLILADDAGFEIGAYNNKICQTQNLDNLARKSLIFNNAYTSVSSCSPSRSALLTGMPSHQNGMYGLHQGENHFNSFDDVTSLPRILRKNKIRSGIIGKKHVGPKSVYSFDYEKTEEHYPILQVGRNITLIKNLVRDFFNSTKGQFFLLVSFHDPHRCGHTTPQYGQFCEKFGTGEPNMGYIPDWQPILYEPDEIQLPFFLPNTLETRQDVAAQYSTISRLDQGVGLVLKELELSGHSNDTLIIYTSDNGIPFPNGRTNLYDPGMAVPMFMSSPLHRQRQNKVTYSLSSLLDVVPTVLDWYEIPKRNRGKNHSKLTGKSLLPLLVEEPKNRTTEAVFASHNLHEVTMYYPMRTVRTHRYKLTHNLNYFAPFPIDQDLYLSPTFQDILNKTRTNQPLPWFKTLKNYYKRPEWELFDLRSDPAEVHNLYNKEEFKKELKELQNKLVEWQKQTNDPWICAPHSVFEGKGPFKNDPQCMTLDNLW